MARQLRIEYPDACYHVTARGNERKDVFTNERDREKFLSYLESAVVRYGAVIHAYCLMNNHYHLLLGTPCGNLSQVMQHINGAYTNNFNAKRKRSGHLFQGRYKAILVEADAYAMELSRYIHLNPVRAGISVAPEEYRWSSYRDYVGLRESPAWLSTEFILGLVGIAIEDAQTQYRQFVDCLSDESEQESPLAGVRATMILGREDFVAEIQARHIAVKQPDRNVPALRQLADRPAIDRIINAAIGEFGEDEHLAKKAAIYLSHRHSGARLREIGERFGVKESAVSQASRRFQRELDTDKELAKMVERLKNRLFLSNV